jgi:uncharacterized protein YybS (DUF2232 family)
MVPATMVVERALGLGDSLLELQKGLVWSAGVFAGSIPGLSAGTADAFTRWLRELTATAVLCPLAFFAAFSAVMFYANHLFSFLVLWRLRIPVAPPADLRTLRTPRVLLVVLPLLVAACGYAGVRSGTVAASLALNALLIALFIAYVGGFAVTVTRLDRTPLRPVLRMGASLLVMFPLFPVAIMLGLADAVIDLRARRERVSARPLTGFRS